MVESVEVFSLRKGVFAKLGSLLKVEEEEIEGWSPTMRCRVQTLSEILSHFGFIPFIFRLITYTRHSSVPSHWDTEYSILRVLFLKSRQQHRSQLFVARLLGVLRYMDSVRTSFGHSSLAFKLVKVSHRKEDLNVAHLRPSRGYR